MSETKGNGKWPLPEGWVWTTIGDIADTTSGGTPLRSHPEYYGGSIPWVKSGELRDGLITEVEEYITEEALKKSSAKLFPKGTALVAMYGATVGRTGILGLDATTNQAVCGLFPKNDSFTNKYMIFWLFSQREELVALSSGGAQPNISQGIIRAYHFPLAPLPEQHRIVAEIEKQFTRLDAAVAALKRAKANLARYKAAVLKAAVEGRLVAQDAADEPASELLERILAERRAQWAAANPKKPYVEPKRPEVAGLPGLPVGWVWATVEQVGDVTGGLTKNQKRNNLPMELPYLRVANVYANRLELDNIELIGISPSEVERVRLKRGDLLVVEGNGSVDQIGRVAVWDGSIDPCVHQNHIIKVRFIPKELSNFCLFWLLSSGGRNQITLVASSTSGLYTLSLSKVASLLMPLPPLSEQKKIVEEAERQLSIIQSAEQPINANLARAERLRQGVLGKAFRGELVASGETSEVF